MPATDQAEPDAGREPDMLQVDCDVALDIIGVVEGADKSSSVAYGWDYLRHYEAIFQPFRHAAINVLEIGVRSGDSLRLWQWYFSVATIIGIDIDEACLAHRGDRVHIAIGSQADPAFLAAICAAHPPSIFIDDGSHRAHHNIFTFEQVFPRLLPGGVYVVEDLKFHFGPGAAIWQGPQPRSAPAYFLDLGRNCLAGQASPGAEHVPPGLTGMVDRVLFVGGAAIITKRKPRRSVDRALATAQTYLAGRPESGDAYLRLAAYVLKHGGDPAAALAMGDAALAASGPTMQVQMTRATILQLMGRLPEALAALREAAALPGGDRPMLMALARQCAAAGLTEAALATVERVLALRPGHEPALFLREKLTRGGG